MFSPAGYIVNKTHSSSSLDILISICCEYASVPSGLHGVANTELAIHVTVN